MLISICKEYNATETDIKCLCLAFDMNKGIKEKASILGAPPKLGIGSTQAAKVVTRASPRLRASILGAPSCQVVATSKVTKLETVATTSLGVRNMLDELPPRLGMEYIGSEISPPLRVTIPSPLKAKSWAREVEIIDFTKDVVGVNASVEMVKTAGIDQGLVTVSSKAHQMLDGMSNSPEHGKNTWSSIVSMNSSPSKLTYVPRVIKDGKLILPAGLAKLGEKRWKHCLVGHCVDKFLPFTLVKDTAMCFWMNYGLVDTLSSAKGIFLFKFENA